MDTLMEMDIRKLRITGCRVPVGVEAEVDMDYWTRGTFRLILLIGLQKTRLFTLTNRLLIHQVNKTRYPLRGLILKMYVSIRCLFVTDWYIARTYSLTFRAAHGLNRTSTNVIPPSDGDIF